MTISLAAVIPANDKPRAIDACAVAESDLAAAYSDCHKHHRGSYIPERNLNFCCPVTVDLAEAQRLLHRYVPGYNEFDPKLLKGLPTACRVRLAREGSVCLYVETTAVLDKVQIRQDLQCDEFDLYQVFGEVRTYRLWWD